MVDKSWVGNLPLLKFNLLQSDVDFDFKFERVAIFVCVKVILVLGKFHRHPLNSIKIVLMPPVLSKIIVHYLILLFI